MSNRRLSILCVDDEQDHADLVRLVLEQLPGLCGEFVHEPDPDAVIETIERGAFDLIFLDYQLGPRTGLDVLRAIRGEGYDHPIILLTAQGDEYVAVEVTRAGADEYLVKQDLTPDVMRHAIENARTHCADRVERDQLGERVERLESLSRALAESSTEIAIKSRRDALTRLMNRETIDEAISTEHHRSVSTESTYAIVMIDIDHFKALNDAVGHQAGDEALRDVANCIRAACRGDDSVGRYGGEEFIVLLPDTDHQNALTIAERIVGAVRFAAIAHPGLGGGRHVTISAGVALGPAADGWEHVVATADQALYHAKDAGRDQVCTRAAA